MLTKIAFAHRGPELQLRQLSSARLRLESLRKFFRRIHVAFPP